MDPNDATGLLREQQNPSSPHFQADAIIPGWRKYAHLYTPLITSAIVILYAPGVAQRLGLQMNEIILFIAATGIPAYLIGSSVYPKDRPAPTPDQSVRFSRKSSLYRAVIIATYGRIYGTPFNIQFYIADLAMSFVAGWLIGERPAGTVQRRSEFLVALMWIAGNHFISRIIPNIPVLVYFFGGVDRTLFRAAYVALVDDVIGVLTRPNVATFGGKLTLVLVQAFTIVSTVYLAFSLLARRNQTTGVAPSLDPSELEVQN